MDGITNLTALLAAMTLGLMAGALLAEAGILVPFWRSLQPNDFLVWYKRYAALLQNFFGPLEIAAALLVMAAAALSWFHQSPGRQLLAVSAALSIAVLASFPIYFQRTNTSFRTGSIPPDSVAAELRRWSIWHWVRTAIAAAAFGLALVAVSA